MKSKVFNNTSILDDRWYDDTQLYMFAIPMINGEINFDLIKSCCSSVKVSLLSMFSTDRLMEMKATDSPLFSILNEEHKSDEIKEKLIKFSVFDMWTNGGKYFYSNLNPSYELRTDFKRVKDKKEDSKIGKAANSSQGLEKNPKFNKSKANDSFKYNSETNCNFITYYMARYGIKVDIKEEIYQCNKFTTFKENLKKNYAGVSNPHCINISIEA